MQKSCIKFRPFLPTDKDYLWIRGNELGCWSYVGRQGGAQVLNLQLSACVYHGTIVHELIHTLGFYHQQSAIERDDWVSIHWENIEKGKFIHILLLEKQAKNFEYSTVVIWRKNVMM